MSQREKTEYTGGEVRNLTEESNLTLALLFNSVGWNSADVLAFNVATSLLNTYRLRRNILQKHSYVDVAEALNFHFSDAGLFGLRVSGSADKAKDVLNLTVAELKGLASSVSADELALAKSVLKNQVLTALERQSDRLEESVKNLRTFNKVQHVEYAK